MDIIELARELGKAVQQDEDYIKMRIAEQNSESDEELCKLIAKNNSIREMISDEACKPDRDDAKMQELNKEMRHVYAQIMSNENMAEFTRLRKEFDIKIHRVLAIVQNSAMGENPETTDLSQGCSGSCGSCSGCM
ncbi:MAG: YlbF family regulator [Acutalibacteraceae bacterium]|nr:YlbF family regulator [Clostridia bacterium]MEE3449284.1 YlbF family regulator [Acutalibacteraceae bacterium]